MIVVDHIAPGYVLLDVDQWGKLEPLTESPYLDLDEAIEVGERERKARHYELPVMFSRAAVDQAQRDARSVPERT